MIGSCNPYSFEIPSYLGYDISKLKDNVRFIEICVNRDGNCNSIIALYFDGSVSYFNELPLPNSSTEMAKVYEFIKKRDEIATKRNGISMFTYAKKHTSGYLFLQKFINKYKK